MARAELALSLLLLIATVFVWMALPGGIGRMFTPWWYAWLPPAGFAGVIMGLIWMFRIYRAEPEPDQRAWRYRDSV